MKSIAILGSTGSIGTQCLDVIRRHRDRYRVVGLTAGRNHELLLKQIEEFRPDIAGIQGDLDLSRLPTDWEGELIRGPEACLRIASMEAADLVVVSTVGAAGLEPTIEAISNGKDIALANKEVLVMAGDLVMEQVRRQKVKLLPIDSEHSAVFQCLTAGDPSEVDSIILTASGGPFLEWDIDRIRDASPEDALNHPRWKMGDKISIDSASMFNKGLEIIEAHHLFGVSVERIRVMIHPQSIVHSMVEFCDGSLIAQLGTTDMRTPIQFALSYPDRLPATADRLGLDSLARLEFREPDAQRFPCLRLAREAAALGGTMPAFVSVANEELVQAFLSEKIKFGSVPALMEQAMERHRVIDTYTLDTLRETDTEARSTIRELISQSVE